MKMATSVFLVPLYILIALDGPHHSISSSNNYSTGPRIYNGYQAEIREAKHQVSIRLRIMDLLYFGMGHLCGGSLISPSVVLTAAHCLRSSSDEPLNKTQLSVVMGTSSRYNLTNDTLIRGVKDYITHRNFNRTTLAYDIAYVVLDSRVPANHPTIQPIELIDTVVPEGTLCRVTGWGLTENRTMPQNLLAVDVRTIDINLCNVGYESELKLIGQICAGYMEGLRDACSGDSGGPLVCNEKLTGIVSFGDGCGMPNKPGIYTDVWFFIDWIERLNLIRELEDMRKGCTSTSNSMSSHFPTRLTIMFALFVSSIDSFL